MGESTWICTRSDDIYHSGIKGMKWGVRRYQNPDGSLTPEGKLRYNESSSKGKLKYENRRRKAYEQNERNFQKGKISKKQRDNLYKSMKMGKAEKEYRKTFKEFNDYVNNITTPATLLGGPVVGVLASTVALNAMPRGRELCDRLSSTKMKYLES